jgi:SHS2 domain-containing protein
MPTGRIEAAQPANASGESGWEHFPHGADIGVRGWGPSPARAFEQAALALTRIVTAAEVRPEAEVAVACEAPDLDLLLVEWLNAVVFEMAVRRMLFGRFAVTVEGEGGSGGVRLSGRLWGEPVDIARHAPAVEPKGATCTALRVAREPGGRWSAACVVDV